MHRKFAALLCAAVVVGLSSGAALAGEVKGPPGTPDPTNPIPGTSGPTAAPAHANSACAFSGLNDLNVGQGPTDFIVQSPGQTMRAGLTPPGVPGHGTGIPGFFENGCRGGSNPDNPYARQPVGPDTWPGPTSFKVDVAVGRVVYVALTRKPVREAGCFAWANGWRKTSRA